MKKLSGFGKNLMFSIKNTYTIGISWIPVAVAFGLIVRESGVPFYWAGLSGILCPAGSLQMLIFSFVMSNVSWWTVIVASAAIAFRHMFYGLSFLDRFRKFGRAKNYMIYMLCDELYSVYCSTAVPEELDEKQVHLITAVLLQFYWVGLSTVFALLGSVITVDLSGVDFALTALFAVILIEMILTSRSKLPVICAALCGIVSLVIFGSESFLIPSLISVSAALILLRKFIEAPRKEDASNE